MPKRAQQEGTGDTEQSCLTAFLDWAEVVLGRARAAETKLISQPLYDDGGFGHVVAEEPPREKLLRVVRECIGQGAVPVVRAHLDAGVLHKPELIRGGDNARIPDPSVEQVAQPLADKLLQPIAFAVAEKGSLELDREELACAYAVAREEWSSTKVTAAVAGPFIGLSAVKEFAFVNGVRIMPFEDADKLDSPIFGFDHTLTRRQLADVEWQARLEHDLPKGSRVDTQANVVAVQRVCHALRLAGPGRIGLPLVWAFGVSRVAITRAWSMHDAPDLAVRMGSFSMAQSYEATEDLLGVANDLLVLLGGEPGPALGLAIRRFNQSYGRALDEDRVLDLVVALDASLLPDQKGAYALAVRAARLTRRHRGAAETRQVIESAYRIRNDIVHGGGAVPVSIPVGGRRLPKGRWIEVLEEVVRAVLRELLRSLGAGKTLKQIVAEIDAGISATIV